MILVIVHPGMPIYKQSLTVEVIRYLNLYHIKISLVLVLESGLYDQQLCTGIQQSGVLSRSIEKTTLLVKDTLNNYYQGYVSLCELYNHIHEKNLTNGPISLYTGGGYDTACLDFFANLFPQDSHYSFAHKTSLLTPDKKTLLDQELERFRTSQAEFTHGSSNLFTKYDFSQGIQHMLDFFARLYYDKNINSCKIPSLSFASDGAQVGSSDGPQIRGSKIYIP